MTKQTTSANHREKSALLPMSPPPRFADVPGIMGEAIRWAENSIDGPNRPLVFGVVLSVLGALATDRFRIGNLRPNLNTLIAAPSPAGKTTAIKWALDLFGLHRRDPRPISGFASRVALNQTVKDDRAFVWVFEHADIYWPKAKVDLYLEHFKIPGSKGNLLTSRVPFAFDRNARRNSSFRRFAESALVIANGFGNGYCSPIFNKPARPVSLLTALAWWMKPAGEPLDIPVAAEAEALLRETDGTAPYARKLAMLYAASANPEQPAIGPDAAGWGLSVARHCALRLPANV